MKTIDIDDHTVIISKICALAIKTEDKKEHYVHIVLDAGCIIRTGVSVSRKEAIDKKNLLVKEILKHLYGDL
jgi:hypothetical protein